MAACFRQNCIGCVFVGIACLFLASAICHAQDANQIAPANANQEVTHNFEFQRSFIQLPTSMYGGYCLDRDGFLWISSVGRGVYRYDGQELKRYPHGLELLSGSMVSSIVEDHDGDMWFATFSHGLTQYVRSTGKFIHHVHDPENVNSLSGDSIPFSPNALCVDRKGVIWVGTTGGGVCTYDKHKMLWTRYLYNENDESKADASGPGSDSIHAMYESRSGHIWAGTKGGGLSRYDPTSGKWTTFRHDPANPKSISGDWANALCEDETGGLWIGTKNSGLCRFDENSETFTRVGLERGGVQAIARNEIWDVKPARDGKIWICHVSGGVGMELFDPVTGTFSRFSSKRALGETISSNSVYSVFDNPKTGELWVFHFGGEIDKATPQSGGFKQWKHLAGYAAGLSDNMVGFLAEDRDGAIWIATTRGGLDKLDRKSGIISHFRPKGKDPTAIPRVNVTALCEDSDGILWIGSWGGILSRFNRKTGLCEKHYRHRPGVVDSAQTITACQRVKYILEDADDSNVLWLATIGGGLDRFDKTTETFTHFKHDQDNPNSLSHNSTVALFDDGNGMLWITTYGGGLNLLDKATGEFVAYRHNPKDKDSIFADVLYEVFEDRKGQLWITGKGGLARLDRGTGQFVNFGVESGLPATIISACVEDDQGQFWLGTLDAGLVVFDPKTGESHTSHNGKGADSLLTFWNSRLKSRDGAVWFGGPSGIVRIQPNAKKVNQEPPNVALTSFTQGGSDLELGSSAERLSEVTLGWQENFFEFRFAGLSFVQPGKNEYAYMLQGRDTDWFYAGHIPTGRYTGLEPGEYVLLLKAANNDGVWSDPTSGIRITVRAPFWQTAWFAAMGAAFIVMAILGTIYYTRRLRVEVRERGVAQAMLREKESNLRVTLDSIGDGVIAADENGIVVRLNTVAEQLTGWQRDHAIGSKLQDVFKLVHSDTREPIACPTTKVAERNSVVDVDHRVSLVAKDETVRRIDCIAAPIRADDGSVLGSVLAFHDETQQHEMEERLRQSEKMDAIGQLAGGVAHDFNNLLAGIMGATDMLGVTLSSRGLTHSRTAGHVESGRESGQQSGHEAGQEFGDDPDADEVNDYLEMIQNATERAAGLTTKLLAFSRKSQTESLVFNLHDVVLEVIAVLERTIDKKIKVVTRLLAEQCDIVGDPNQIHSAIFNLGINARDAMPEGGTIAFSTEQVHISEEMCEASLFDIKAGHFIKLAVSDTGTGIDVATTRRIFEPFFTTKEQGKGTGLGLAAVYGMVKDHHGMVSVESAVGEGTTISIDLPVATTNTMTDAPDQTQTQPRKGDWAESANVYENTNELPVVGSAGTVLVVEDELLVQKTAEAILNKLGFDVILACDGVEGVSKYRDRAADIDLVLLDMVMPKMDGRQCLSRMREINPNVKAVMASGFVGDSNDDQMEDLSLAGFLAKPYHAAQLKTVIEKIV
jgi:PAS domain S-box-containing protein